MTKSSDIFLTLKHYKEPLTEVKQGEGFGYYGAIQVTTDGQYVQCHVCGKLYADVSSHARQAHKISIPEYKEKFQLSPNTALISEFERIRRKSQTLEWLKTLTEEQKAEYRRRCKERLAEIRGKKKIQPKESLENKNKKGTCPQQILQKILDVAEQLGHTPSLGEFIEVTDGQRYKHLIFKVYGSWSNALKMLNLNPSQRKPGKKHNYSDDELLEMLALFAEENRKIPTATDCKRGLLPDFYVYVRHFGTFEKARELAGVYDFVE